MRTWLMLLALTSLAGLSGCKKDESIATPVAPPTPGGGPRVIAMSVTEKGFEPAKISLIKGAPVKFVVTRTTESTCATELLVDGTDINVPLPLNAPTSIDFTPAKSGQVKFGCAMDKMVSGVLLIE